MNGRAALPRPLVLLEAFAPFGAGLLLFACGGLSALHILGIGRWPAGPLGDTSLAAALLIAGAGVGILLASWEVLRMRRVTDAARRDAARTAAERDMALLQARRLRVQAEGLALMREIHRSTAIPDRGDRLHRILTLLGELFEAREVALFAASGDGREGVQPAAYLKVGSQEEAFLCFEPGGLGDNPSGPDLKDAKVGADGARLRFEAQLVAGEFPVGKVQWLRAGNSPDADAARQNPDAAMEALLERLDYGPSACRHAARALDQRRTLRQKIPAALHRTGGGESALIVCVPLMADQKPVGVLRIRAQADDMDPAHAGLEAVEELLVESAKHIALAMKKDEDDRRAITDQLTDLFIKRHFLSHLELLRAEVGGGARPFGLLLCDIDHFKQVNDTHGHLSGDLILKGVARVLRSGLRAGDMAFRYGGEEMAILMPGATPEAAQQTAERLRQAVERTVFRGEKNQAIPITLSIGVALFRSGLNGQQLIGRADRALYASKHGGRNRVTCWTPELPDPLDQKAKEKDSARKTKASTKTVPAK